MSDEGHAHWTPEKGWHNCQTEMRLVLDERGRIKWIPKET